MHSKDAEGIANSVDSDQTAPLGAVWSGSALFAQTCLSKNLGKYYGTNWLWRKNTIFLTITADSFQLSLLRLFSSEEFQAERPSKTENCRYCIRIFSFDLSFMARQETVKIKSIVQGKQLPFYQQQKWPYD